LLNQYHFQKSNSNLMLKYNFTEKYSIKLSNETTFFLIYYFRIIIIRIDISQNLVLNFSVIKKTENKFCFGRSVIFKFKKTTMSFNWFILYTIDRFFLLFQGCGSMGPWRHQTSLPALCQALWDAQEWPSTLQ